jgi:hypothetical protein
LTATSRYVLAAVVAVALPGLLLVDYLRSPLHAGHDPLVALQQLDLLYLDEPAPLLDQLAYRAGQPLVVVVCDGCAAPDLDVPVTVTDDRDVARAYGLVAADGRVGPGYALVDGDGDVRYRTFDARLSRNAGEMGILVRGL